MSGIFSTLYNLKLKSQDNPLEDYITEIFCYCLNSDIELLKSFLKHFNIYEEDFEEFSLSTQLKLNALEEHYNGSRPDMALFANNFQVYFESKIGSLEGNDQLQRYAEHLSQTENTKKVLVYITRDYDRKDPKHIFSNCKNYIEFIPIRWFEVFKFLKRFKENSIVFELLTFMKKNHLSMSNQFSPIDVLTLSNFSPVNKLLDECMFGKVSDEFIRINGGISQKSTCLTQLREHDRYIFYRDHYDGLMVGLGFWMNSITEKDYPEIGVIVQIKPKSLKRKEVVEVFKCESLKDDSWTAKNINDDSRWATLFKGVSLQNYLSSENQIADIQDFYMNTLKKVEKLFMENPELPFRPNEIYIEG